MNPVGPGCETSSEPSTRVLSIAPVAQQTEVWCWAATAEMVFRHYGLPSVNGFGNYQCGIVAAYFGGACTLNCGLCVAPIGSLTEMNRVVQLYGQVARQLGLASPILSTSIAFSALSFQTLRNEIDANRPVIAGITAGGFPFPNISQHAVLLVGYEQGPGGAFVYVNDPFPYNLPQFILQGRPNPYAFVGAVETRPGQYRLSYSSLTGFMAWGNSIYGIRPA